MSRRYIRSLLHWITAAGTFVAPRLSVLRIFQATAVDGSVVLRLEGTLRGPWVGELRELSSGILQRPTTRLVLDLSEVSFIDAQGLELLRELSSRSVSLRNCSLLVTQQLKSSEEVQ